MRQAGVRLISLLVEAEVQERSGERSQSQAERTETRWGSERA
jgi:hypothetical protein